MDNVGPSGFGLFSVVAGIVSLTGFLNGIMISTTYRFIAFEIGRNDNNGVNEVFNISLIIHLIIALIIYFLSETLGIWYIRNKLVLLPGQLNTAIVVFRFSVLTAILGIITVPYQALFISNENFKFISILEVLKSFLSFIASLVIGFILFDKLKLYVILSFYATILITLILVFYCIRTYKNYTRLRWINNWKLLKQLLVFSNWNIISVSSQLGKESGSQLIINSFFGTIPNASYAMAGRLSGFLSFFSSTFSQSTAPQITKCYSTGNTVRVHQLVVIVGKYTFFLMCFPAIPLLIETKFLINLFFGEVPNWSIIFTRLMVIYSLLSTPSSGFPALINASGKLKWFQLSSNFLILSGIPISIFLFKLNFEPYFILIGYIILTIIALFITTFLLKKIICINIKYLARNCYFKIFLVATLCSPLFLIPLFWEHSLSRIFFTVTLSTVWLTVVVYFFGLDARERKKLRYKLMQSLQTLSFLWKSLLK